MLVTIHGKFSECSLSDFNNMSTRQKIRESRYCTFILRVEFNKFPDLFVQIFKIGVDS